MIKEPKVSLIICTHNNAQGLAETLESLKSLRVPDDLPTELIIVDNASTDETAQVASGFQWAGVSTSYIYEPHLGQVHARNAGIKASIGQIILFTDDDVRPPRNWIEAMCKPIAQGITDAVGGGVKLAAHLERSWMQDFHRQYLSDTSGFATNPTPFLIGANMAFSREISSRISFDTQLGPGALGFCDDVLFYRQIQRANYRTDMALDVIVEHHVHESRLSRSSFITRAQKEGRSHAYLDYHWEHKIIRYPRRQLINTWFNLIKFRLKRVFQPLSKEGASFREMELMRDIAFFGQYFEERKRPRNYDKHGLKKLR